MADAPDNCPHCGGPAHRITPMGFWEKATGYSPKGVRYVCGKLYLDQPEPCPGRETFYGDDAEEKALAAWNTRATPPAAVVEAMERALKFYAEGWAAKPNGNVAQAALADLEAWRAGE